MPIARYILFLNLCLISLYSFSLDGHISFDQSRTDKSWSLLDSFNNSFDKNNNNTTELLLFNDKYGFKFTQSDFSLDLLRTTEPKEVNLRAKSYISEIYYFINQDSAISLMFKDQKADDQFIQCYTFSSFTIGSCDDATINITNSDEKYNSLGNNLMKIQGQNEEFQLKFTKNNYSFFSDKLILYIGASKNTFDWITPIEEIQSGFLYNLTINGQKLGDLIQTELSRLPQRDLFYIYKLGISINKEYELNNFMNFFYNADFVALTSKKYDQINKFQNSNIKLETGINFFYNNFDLSIYGILYKNNILGYEDIAFNQRSEHHFDKKFGNLGLKLQYNF